MKTYHRIFHQTKREMIKNTKHSHFRGLINFHRYEYKKKRTNTTLSSFYKSVFEFQRSVYKMRSCVNIHINTYFISFAFKRY